MLRDVRDAVPYNNGASHVPLWTTWDAVSYTQNIKKYGADICSVCFLLSDCALYEDYFFVVVVFNFPVGNEYVVNVACFN